MITTVAKMAKTKIGLSIKKGKKKDIFLKSFMGVGAMDFHFTTSCVTWLIPYAINGFTEPLGGWGKGPGYEVVIKGRRNLSRDQMFLEVCRITARGCPGYEDHWTQNHQSDELKKVAGQMLRRGLIHSRDFVFGKPPRSVTWRNQYGPEGG